MSERARRIAADAAWGALWAVMLATVILFSGGASRFIYIDF